MKIVVTGGAGFIGQHLCKELEDYGHEVEVIDLVHGNSVESHLDRALEIVQPDVVVHLAAKVGRLFGEDDVRRTTADNAGLTAFVAQKCGEYGTKLVYASTSEVYGDCGELMADDRLWGEAIVGDFLPHNIYGLSKRWGEEVCSLYVKPKNLLIWRISMPYGPGLPAGRGRAAMINFLYNALHGLPITVHKGSERSWCWIGDTVAAMRLTIERDVCGAYNIGRDDAAVSMLALAKLAQSLTSPGSYAAQIYEVDPPERQTVVKRLSTEKIRSLWWEPKVTLSEGMERTLEWVKTLPPPDLKESSLSSSQTLLVTTSSLGSGMPLSTNSFGGSRTRISLKNSQAQASSA